MNHVWLSTWNFWSPKKENIDLGSRISRSKWNKWSALNLVVKESYFDIIECEIWSVKESRNLITIDWDII